MQDTKKNLTTRNATSPRTAPSTIHLGGQGGVDFWLFFVLRDAVRLDLGGIVTFFNGPGCRTGAGPPAMGGGG